jgi:glutaredoxin
MAAYDSQIAGDFHEKTDAATPNPFMKTIRLLFALCLLWALPGPGMATDGVAGPDAVVYTRTGCPYCAEAAEFLARAATARQDFRYEVRNIAEDADALDAFFAEIDRHGIERPGVPLIVVGDEYLLGWQLPEGADRLSALMGWPPDDWRSWGRDGTGEVLPDWLSLDRLGLPAFTVALGLLDGFNPCAMWVLMFLLSMLVHVKSRARMFLIAGIFVAVSGLVYFAFMVAWLNLSLAFRWSDGLRITIALLGIGAAGFHLKDALAGFRGPSLSISEGRKAGIGERVRGVITARNLPVAIGAVIVLAVLVNFYELLCTAGLPAIYTQVLARQEISGAPFYGYLALYNLAYIFDDALMVFAATWALSSKRLSLGAGRWLKALSGAALLALSAVLLLRPEWLSFQ